MSGPAQPVVPPARSTGALVVLAVLGAGVLAVAAAAAVLSFATIEDLGLLVGYAPSLAWLLPGCLDVASALGGVAWLAPVAPRAVPFARVLCLSTLGLSVLANGVGHGLDAYGVTRPPLVLVVLVTAVAPAVLGAVVHLVVLVVRDLVAPAAALVEDEPEGSDEVATPRPCSDWSDEALADDLRRWGSDPSRPAPSRDRVVAEYGVGARRAGRLREMAGVGTEPVPMRVVGASSTAAPEGSA